jgi:hypothetical protein
MEAEQLDRCRQSPTLYEHCWLIIVSHLGWYGLQS